MVLDHIGIVVKSLEKGVENWANLFGYEPATEKVLNTRQKVNVVFLRKPGSLPVKLIEPSEESSPIYAFAQRGGGLHHLCFRVADLHGDLEALRSKGAKVLAAPQPGEAFMNEQIAFIYANQGLNVELIATDKRAKQLPSTET